VLVRAGFFHGCDLSILRRATGYQVFSNGTVPHCVSQFSLKAKKSVKICHVRDRAKRAILESSNRLVAVLLELSTPSTLRLAYS
jgi:hypothetical protein